MAFKRVRCVLSDAGAEQHLVSNIARGVIVGESRDGTCWWILWDGLKGKQAFSKRFIHKIDEKDPHHGR